MQEVKKIELGENDEIMTNSTLINIINSLVYESTRYNFFLLEAFMKEGRIGKEEVITALPELIRDKYFISYALRRFDYINLKGLSFILKFVRLYHSESKEVKDRAITSIFRY